MGDDNSPPPTPSRLRRTLRSLRSPFHIGSIKRSGSTKSSASDGEIVRDERTMRKKNKKQRAEPAARDGSDGSRADTAGPASSTADKKKKDPGNFLRRMGSIGRKREEGSPVTTQPGSVEAVTADTPEREPPLENVEATPPVEVNKLAAPSTPDAPVSPIATTHAVATWPFTKAAWKRNSTSRDQEMEKPIEEPVAEEHSPESALRRRIAFVSQASACLSEDRDEEDDEEGEGEGVGSLEEAVALARARLAALRHSPSPTHNYDTEEERYADAEHDHDHGDGDHEHDAMPPYGDLLQQPADSANASTHASPAAERREHLYKILVIGELGTGKTSIIKRYVHQFFSQHYRATIGVDFALKVLNWDANTIIRLQLWDIAGQERFGNMTRVYYKEAVGAFIVFDVSRVATFDAVVKWKTDLDSKVQLPDGSPIPCILLANKCDQQKEGIVNTAAKMDEYCREKGFAGWFETSAKENINIEEAARSLVNKILLNDKLLHNNDKDGEKFAIDHKIANGENSRDGGNKSCAC